MADILKLAHENSELVYETLCQSPHPIVWTDINSKQIMANDKFLAITGYGDLDHIHGKYYYDSPTEGADFHDPWVEQDKIVLKTKKTGNLISYLKLKGSKDRILTYGIKSPAFNNDGEVIGTVQEYIDVTHCQIMSCIPLLHHHDHSFLTSNEQGGFTYKISDAFRSKDGRIKLTPKQSDCLFFILRGKSAKEIARIFGNSYRVIEHHTQMIHQRFDTFSKSQLIEKAIQLGFINLIPRDRIQKLLSLSLTSG